MTASEIETKENYTFKNLLGSEYSVKTERVIKHIGSNLITRGSSYGAEILCSTTMPIIDIDYTENCNGYSAIKRAKDMCVSLVADYLEQGRKINTNLYRTKKGLRLIISGQHEWDLDEAVEVMDKFDADPIYVMLCEQQGCYRARLTPKPIRVGIRSRSFQVWKEHSDDYKIGEAEAEKLLIEYYTACKKYRTCLLVQRLGGNSENIFKHLLEIHDKRTGVTLHGLPLA